jgi:hypothetical protein
MEALHTTTISLHDYTPTPDESTTLTIAPPPRATRIVAL